VEEEEVEVFKAQMKVTFQMRDLGILCFYLGIEVCQDLTCITLRQAHYAKASRSWMVRMDVI
jgi:tRNA(Ser,Leu) C12 N-acetylase TAN1